MLKKVTVWRAMLDGKCWQIAETEQFLHRELKRNALYKPSEHARWVFTCETMNIHAVRGEVVHAKRWQVELEKPVPDDLGTPQADATKIKWNCPVCGDEHFTGIECGDGHEGLWFCETSPDDAIVLVTWDNPT